MRSISKEHLTWDVGIGRHYVESSLPRVKHSIRLYPNMHQYTAVQRRETAEHIYRSLFARWRPLFQDQDQIVIYRGTRGKGLI